MITFDPANWYWIVAGSTSRVFSSATGAYVALSDATYQSWLAEGGTPTRIASEDELVDMLQTRAPNVVAQFPAGLLAYAAAARFAKETGGITFNGAAVQTDRETQAQLSGAYNYVQVAPSATIQWKQADGSFISLNAAAITAVATAVAVHVQACFGAEATLAAGINASPPMVTTKAAIDAAFAAITT
jgi:hypothetical protein